MLFNKLFLENDSLMKKLKTVLILGILLIFCLIGSKYFKHLTPMAIKEFLIGWGAFAPIIYILLFTFVPLTLFPDALLAISAGLVFGIIPGAIYTIIGAVCGGTLAFMITRTLSHDFVEKKLEEHKKISRMIESRGFMIVLIMRLIPLIPFDVISYAAGATGIKYRDYILATIIGIIPGVTILVTMGDGLGSPDQPKLYLAICAMILLLVLAKRGHKKLFSHENGMTSDEVAIED